MDRRSAGALLLGLLRHGQTIMHMPWDGGEPRVEFVEMHHHGFDDKNHVSVYLDGEGPGNALWTRYCLHVRRPEPSKFVPPGVALATALHKEFMQLQRETPGL